MNKEMTAYLAGLFDGEGSIHMSGRDYKSSVVVTVTNTDISVCRLFADEWGGNVGSYRHTSMSAFSKQINRWYRAGQNAKPFLESLLPYLRIKKPIAELALKLLELRPGAGHLLSSETISQRLKLIHAIYNAQQRQHLM